MRKSVLIIGGAGYIGAHVCAILSEDYSVTVYDDLSTGFKSNVKNAKFIKGSTLDIKKLNKVMSKGFDAVILLAGKKSVEESEKNPHLYIQTNLVGSLNVLDAMIKNKCKNLLFSSSCSVFGSNENIDENSPRHPESFYGLTKSEFERTLESFSKYVDSISLRYFNVAGFDERYDWISKEKKPETVLPKFAENISKNVPCVINGTGENMRDYIHVLDVAFAHKKALEFILQNYGVYKENIGTGVSHSVNEVVSCIENMLGKPINKTYGPSRVGDAKNVNISSKLNHIDWEPQFSFKEIVHSVLVKYRIK